MINRSKKIGDAAVTGRDLRNCLWCCTEVGRRPQRALSPKCRNNECRWQASTSGCTSPSDEETGLAINVKIFLRHFKYPVWISTMGIYTSKGMHKQLFIWVFNRSTYILTILITINVHKRESLSFAKYCFLFFVVQLTTHPFEAFRVTALLLFIVDSRNFPALRSQNSKSPIPVPMVKILPLKVTDRIPQPLLRLGIFLMAWKEMVKNIVQHISLSLDETRVKLNEY